jgi:hypothetical protein
MDGLASLAGLTAAIPRVPLAATPCGSILTPVSQVEEASQADSTLSGCGNSPVKPEITIANPRGSR